MKISNSLKSLRKRHRDCKLVIRSGIVMVINKLYPKFKAKQGQKKHPKFNPGRKHTGV